VKHFKKTDLSTALECLTSHRKSVELMHLLFSSKLLNHYRS